MSITLQNFYKTTITRNWTTATGDFNVAIKPTVSSGYLVISPNNTTLREIIKYTATGTNAYGDFVTVSERGVGGTSTQTHTIGEAVRMNITAEHWALVPGISSGITTPSEIPTKIGDIYIDTVLGKVYIATGTSSSSDYKILN